MKRFGRITPPYLVQALFVRRDNDVLKLHVFVGDVCNMAEMNPISACLHHLQKKGTTWIILASASLQNGLLPISISHAANLFCPDLNSSPHCIDVFCI